MVSWMMEKFRLEIERKEERDIWGKEKWSQCGLPGLR